MIKDQFIVVKAGTKELWLEGRELMKATAR